MTFTQWYTEADIPTQDKDGNWYDAETGHYFNVSETKTKAKKHPDAWMTAGAVRAKVERLVASQKIAISKFDGDCSLAKDFVEKAEIALSQKTAKAQMLELITACSEASRYMNNIEKQKHATA